MSHQPFETWILDQETLSPDERRNLQAHLAACEQCQRIERKWQSVHQELRARRMVAPAPGFTQRWQASLVERRAREQRRQAWRIFGILLSTALFFLLVLAGYLMVTTTPAEWLEAVFRVASSSEVFIQMTIYTLQNWLANTPLALHIALWIYLTFTLCVLSLAWVGIVWRTKNTAGAVES